MICLTQCQQINNSIETDYPEYVIEQEYTIGNHFLDQASDTFNMLFYDITGLFSFNIWEGFIKGLYDDHMEKLALDTCLGGRSKPYLESIVLMTE